MVGGRLMEIANDVIESLNQWNTPPNHETLDVDFPFALAVFLSLVSPKDISEDHIDPSAIVFVKGKFELRVLYF